MLGSEILDVVLGLAFVYLLLSLVCSAINEYVAALLNRRGEALIAGIEQLLEDAKDPHLKSDVLNHRLIRSMYTRSMFGRERKPSYIPARSFAMALLDSVENPSHRAVAAASAAAQPAGSPPEGGDGQETQSVREILDLLKDDALGDVVQTFGDSVKGSPLPVSARRAVANAVATSRTDLQKLHDSVEVWFNNAMDRVSGVYKRQTQMWLFFIGLLVSILMNADSISMWRQLSANQQLRDSLAKTAVAQVDSLGAAVRPDTTVPPDLAHAKDVYDVAMNQLDRSQLRFGWSAADLDDLKGVWTKRGTGFLPKLLGVLFTAVALSLGAPFWFDVLNKIINIRATGRAPNERAKNPEAPGKRMAEVSPK